MKQLLDDVRAFHEACGVPCLDRPAIPDFERIDLRLALIDEEQHELIDAAVEGDLVRVADGIADLIYVLVGTALELGIPLDRVWAEVHRANMAKVDPVTGKVRKREDGKVLKPEGWTPPDIESALYGEAVDG